MHGAPRAASAWLFDPVSPGRRGWGKDQRLLRASEFAALANSPLAWRAARRWIAMSVRVEPDSSPSTQCATPGQRLRFGLTVPKRQAKRAVARNMVKRVLREAARDAAPRLDAAAAGTRADVLLRLKAPLPAAATMTWSALKIELRREADALMGQLAERLRAESQRAARALSRGDAPLRDGHPAPAGQEAAAMLAQSKEGAPAPGDESAGAPS
jgi:ribonuclease P protein component